MNIIANPELLTNAVFQKYLENKGQHQQIQLNQLSERVILDKCVSDVNFLQKIPILSNQAVGNIRPDTLCRFRGIVLDLYDIEFFTGHIYDPRSDKTILTKYKDTIPQDLLELQGDDDGYSKQQKNIYARQPILLSAIPGESEWCKSHHDVNDDVESSGQLDRSNKRTLDAIVSPFSAVSKVRSDLSPPDVISLQTTGPVATHTVSPSVTHELPTTATLVHNNSGSSCVLVKVYDGLYEELRLNDLVEVVGIYTCDPALLNDPFPVSGVAVDDEYPQDDQGMVYYEQGFGEGLVDRLPAPSIAPRLHCITLRRYTLTHEYIYVNYHHTHYYSLYIYFL